MSSKRKLRRDGCTGKHQYTDLHEATKAARIARYETGQQSINPYKCLFGNHWHIGHRPAKIARRIFQAKMVGATK